MFSPGLTEIVIGNVAASTSGGGGVLVTAVADSMTTGLGGSGSISTWRFGVPFCPLVSGNCTGGLAVVSGTVEPSVGGGAGVPEASSIGRSDTGISGGGRVGIRTGSGCSVEAEKRRDGFRAFNFVVIDVRMDSDALGSIKCAMTDVSERENHRKLSTSTAAETATPP